MSDFLFLPATQMARLIRAKKLSARELLGAHLKQIDRVNPQVNAIVTLTREIAMAQAAEADESAAHGRFLGPLHGLPIAHKDLLDTKGVRTTYGSPIFRDYVPAADPLVVQRIRQAGAIFVGKTNTPEFGAGSQTFNPVFGATRNPWDVTKTCGGSSGGAAVALACGMLPLADGSDMGGSLRNPASFCSVVGLRPSPGRVPAVPSLTSPWQALSVLGPMGRTAADAALLLSVMAGPDGRSAMSLDDPGSNFAPPLERDFRSTRIAWCSSLADAVFERRVIEIFERHRQTFERLGCTIEEAQPDLTDADEIFRTQRAAAFFSRLWPLARDHRSSMKATVIEEIERGAAISLADLARADTAWSRLLERTGEFMARYDYFVLPTTQVAPFEVDRPWPREIDGVAMNGYIDWMRSCYYVTVTALPAISVPAGFTEEGLPVGLQIVGRHHDDRGVLEMADAFEKASGVGVRVPPAALNSANCS
jgi:amidase